MEIKVGNDLVSINRFRKALNNSKIKEKIFTQSELKNPTVIHLAGIFAAKEAILKALDLDLGLWQNIEILNKKTGKPIVKLSNEIINKRILDFDLSISHDSKYAIATFVVLLK